MQREHRAGRHRRADRSRQRLRGILSAVIAVSAASLTRGQNVYTSTNVSGYWSNPGNWTSGVTPSSGIDTELDFGGAGGFGLSFIDDIGAGTFTLNEIQFNSTAIAPATISANAPSNTLTFVNNSLSAAPQILQNGSGAYVITNGLVLGNTLLIGGTGTGGVNLAGSIGGAGGLTIGGSAVVTLGTANTYTGPTTVNSGVLSISSLTDEGSGSTGSNPSGIGQSNNAAANLVLNGGTLQYTGPATSTDRLFTLGGNGGTLDASGSGALTITNPGAILLASSSLGRTLTLTGASTAANTLAASLGDGTAPTSLLKTGGGTWQLTGKNTFTGDVTINAGTLELNDATGALSSASNLNFTGSGTFLYDNSGATTHGSQALNALRFAGGDGTVEINFNSSSQNIVLLFDHVAARAAGATGNFIVNGGVNGVSDAIVPVNNATHFINQGEFFGGNAYAWIDDNSFVRSIAYTPLGNGADAGAVTSSGGSSVSGTYVQTTGAITNQPTSTFTTLNLAGNNNFTLGAGALLTVNGILKSGNSAGGAIVSGGQGVMPAPGAELVIRTDLENDSLAINLPVLANGANALTKSGAGTLTFGGANTYTGTTTINSGTLSFLAASGSSGGGSLIVGGAAGNAVLNVATSGTITFNGAQVGGITGLASSPSAAGVVNQSSGTFNYAAGPSSYFDIGTGVQAAGCPGGYGAYLLSGGTLTSNGSAAGMRIGAVGLGAFTQTGGALVLGREMSIGTYGTGVATFSGGTTTGSSGYGILIGDATGVGTLNLGTQAGGNATLQSQSASGVELAVGSGTIGTLNLDSGTLLATAGSLRKGSGASGIINFNGGALQAGASGLTLIDATPTAVNVYNGGATIDTQGFTATVAAPLQATAGSGLYPSGGLLSVTSGGSGYFAAPLVNVTGGSGTGAMAIANVSGGAITGLTLTNPGQNYQPGDVLNFSFAGGGPTAAAPTFSYALRVSDMSLNSAGGLSKLGSGTLILSASNTYVGATNVINGTLQVDGSLGNTAVNVSSGSTLAGKGTIANAGANSVSISGAIAPGNPATDASLTTGPMSWNGGGDYVWKVSQLPTGSPASGAGTNWDQISFSNLNVAATPSNPFIITPVGNPPGIAAGQAYTWQIAQLAPGGGGSISGFNASNFVLNTAQFAGGAYSPSDFGLSVNNGALDLTLGYSPAPEPSSLAMVALAGALLLGRRRRSPRASHCVS